MNPGNDGFDKKGNPVIIGDDGKEKPGKGLSLRDQEKKQNIVFDASTPIDQQWFDYYYGYHTESGGTASCNTISLLNLYAASTNGGLDMNTLSAILTAASESIYADGSPRSFEKISILAARFLGRDSYYNYVYKNGDMITMSERQFQQSGYRAGIVRLKNPNKVDPHFVSELLTPAPMIFDSFDPNRPEASGYTSSIIRPLQLLPAW